MCVFSCVAFILCMANLASQSHLFLVMDLVSLTLRASDSRWLLGKRSGILLSANAPWFCCQLGTSDQLPPALSPQVQPAQETHPSPAPTLSLTSEAPLLLPINNGVCVSFDASNPQLVRSICAHNKGRLITRQYFIRHHFHGIAWSLATVDVKTLVRLMAESLKSAGRMLACPVFWLPFLLF